MNPGCETCDSQKDPDDAALKKRSQSLMEDAGRELRGKKEKPG